MRWLDNNDCLPGLLPASFRGVPFWVLDAAHETGRRIAQTLFPGRDGIYHDDTGRHDGQFSIAAIVVGDDYVSQAQRLQQALSSPGPGTLVHPWLGEQWVVISAPASISFATNNLRVASLDLCFEPTASDFDAVSTIAALLSSVSALISAASGLMSAVMSSPVLSLVAWAVGRDAAAAMAGSITTIAGRQPDAPRYLAALEPSQAALAKAETLTPGPEAATALATALVDMPRAIVSAASQSPASAIGRPAAVVTTDPGNGAQILLTVAAGASATETLTLTDTAVTLALEAAALAGAAGLASEIRFESRQQALDWRNRIDTALGACSSRSARLAGDMPGPVAALRAAISTLRSDLARDINEVNGRLPAVRTITPQATVSAFLLAQHLAGDTPRNVVAMVDDITRRNRLSHPGAIPSDPVEILI